MDNYTDSYPSLKETSLYEIFADGAVTDPLKIVEDKEAYMVDGDIDRKDKVSIFSYLREKETLND